MNREIPNVPFHDWEKAAKRFRDLTRERSAAAERLLQLESQTRQAKQADEQALADALRAGKPDPGDVTQQQLREQIEQTQRRLHGLELAVAAEHDAFAAHVERNREKYLDAAARELDAAHQGYVSAIAAITTARERVAAARYLARVVANFPERTKRGAEWFSTNEHGNAVGIDSVIASLTADAQRLGPKPVTERLAAEAS